VARLTKEESIELPALAEVLKLGRRATAGGASRAQIEAALGVTKQAA